jgi:PleD family two-component response regulator
VNRLIVLMGTLVCRAGDLKGDRMKAIELSGLEGFQRLRVADVEKPKPAANQRGESSMRRAVIPEISGNRQIAQKEEKLMATTILGTAFHPLIAEPRPAPMGRILVIEDDGALRKILRRLFSSEGYEVDVVPDAVCGLEKLRQGVPVAVVLDLRRPGFVRL